MKRSLEWGDFEEEVDNVGPLTSTEDRACRQVTTRQGARRANNSTGNTAATRSANRRNSTSTTRSENNTDSTRTTRAENNTGSMSTTRSENTSNAGATRLEVDAESPSTSTSQDGATGTSSTAPDVGEVPDIADITWTRGYSPAELSRAQRDDPEIRWIHDWMDRGEKPSRDEAASLSPATRSYWLNYESLVRTSGVIYLKWIDPDDKRPTRYRLLVPRKMRSETLQQCHDSVFGAHLGINKTIDRVKQRYHWYLLRSDVKLHIQTCPVCTANRQPYRKFRASLANFRVGSPMDRIGVDLMGPLPLTERGNRYLLVLADYFTRWAEAFPLPNQQAETVAHTTVMEFVCRYGAPLEMHSDQAQNFQSVLFTEVCRLLDISKTRSSPYHPSSNGLVERYNRTLAGMIRSYIDNNVNDWDRYIPLLTSAYRSTVHPSTGFTPNFLMFGREVTTPADIMFPRPAAMKSMETDEYAQELRVRLEECYDLARDQLKKSAERQQKEHDTRIVQNQYQPGQLVYKRHHNHKKFEIPWVGPYVVMEMLSDCLYRVADKRKTYVLHHDLLKPYQSRVIPVWATKKSQELCSKTQ